MSAQRFQWSLGDYAQQQSQCDDMINGLDDWNRIPTINHASMDTFTDGSFARFQGMVQDVLNPEYYIKNYNVKDIGTGSITSRDGKYVDVLQCKETEKVEPMVEDGSNHDVRQPLFCIPIPGFNNWAESYNGDSSKRTDLITSAAVKRPHPDDEMDMEVEPKRKIRPPTENLETAVLPYESGKFFPLPDEKGLACIVKHYGDRDDFLVNNRIEAIGFLSLSPALEASWNGCDAEDKAMHPPPSLVPRLHALRIRKLRHCNPALTMHPETVEINCIEMYNRLHFVLTQLLFGDSVAADYLICNLLASVYARKDGLSLGSLSLNLYNILVPGFPHMLFKFLQNILPCSAYIPLTIDMLNKTSFTPKKDYETNRLVSGCLQLADDTHILIDETVLAAGQLDAQGIQNVAALHSLSQHQQLHYDFQYFKLDINTNISVLVLSEGKSMIPTSAPLKVIPAPNVIFPTKETFEVGLHSISGEVIEELRRYLTTIRLRDCDMSETPFIGPCWADLRQENSTLKEDDLHRLIVLSRLLALSRGRTSLTEEDWQKAVALEKERFARVAPSV